MCEERVSALLMADLGAWGTSFVRKILLESLDGL
jgi:hypothetical protein